MASALFCAGRHSLDDGQQKGSRELFRKTGPLLNAEHFSQSRIQSQSKRGAMLGELTRVIGAVTERCAPRSRVRRSCFEN